MTVAEQLALLERLADYHRRTASIYQRAVDALRVASSGDVEQADIERQFALLDQANLDLERLRLEVNRALPKVEPEPQSGHYVQLTLTLDLSGAAPPPHYGCTMAEPEPHHCTGAEPEAHQ